MAPGRSARSAALATLLAALLLLTWPGPGRPQDPDLIVDTDGCGSIEPGTRNVYHTKDHVIMTLAFGMLIRGIEHPYLHSAQHVRRDADVVVLVQRADSHARLQAEGFNHTGIRFIRAYRDPSIKGESIYPIKFRLYSYSCFIRQSTARRFLLTDYRDVVFQRSIFSFPSHALNGAPDNLHMFLETSDFRIRHNTNYMWIERCYNSSVAAAVAGNMIINAGVMLGSTRALLALFPLYIEQANGVTCVEDQPLLNVMVYSGRLFGKVNYSLHSNEFGPVFTGEAAHSYSMDSCSIKNARGQEYAVVHQWDRPKHVKAMVQTCGRFSPGGGHRPQA